SDPDEVLLVWAVPGSSTEHAVPARDAGGPADDILAVLSLHFIPQLAVEGDFARISYFAVDDDARSQGIGRTMEERVVALARERGCHLIEVHCHERRTHAHRFYLRQGYRESPKYMIKNLL
ncbi:MAG TPA: GNAT family N-acetyltransferase, partial [Puia sp.]|nr:GNAT family N-acetyltransferase [Puia sp.]